MRRWAIASLVSSGQCLWDRQDVFGISDNHCSIPLCLFGKGFLAQSLWLQLKGKLIRNGFVSSGQVGFPFPRHFHPFLVWVSLSIQLFLSDTVTIFHAGNILMGTQAAKRCSCQQWWGNGGKGWIHSTQLWLVIWLTEAVSLSLWWHLLWFVLFCQVWLLGFSTAGRLALSHSEITWENSLSFHLLWGDWGQLLWLNKVISAKDGKALHAMRPFTGRMT